VLWYTSCIVNVCLLLTRQTGDTFSTGRLGLFPEHYSLCVGLWDVTVCRLIVFPNFPAGHAISTHHAVELSPPLPHPHSQKNLSDLGDYHRWPWSRLGGPNPWTFPPSAAPASPVASFFFFLLLFLVFPFPSPPRSGSQVQLGGLGIAVSFPTAPWGPGLSPFWFFCGNQNAHVKLLNQQGRHSHFRLHYVRGLTDTWGSRVSRPMIQFWGNM